jgi:pyruvate/2-oxoglutarate dehydrogenase complex dihydrolipoamide acyltransferase (E2) component
MRMLLSSAAMVLVLSTTSAAVRADAVRLAQAAPAQTEPAPPAANSPAAAAPAAPAAAPAAPAAAPAAPAAAPAAPAAAPQKLVGLAAWSQVVGNTITGNENGKVLVEFYAPDGMAKSMTGNEISTGSWALVGETICFKYTDEPKPECYRLEVVGNTATYYDEKGSGTRYEILKGNPKGL